MRYSKRTGLLVVVAGALLLLHFVPQTAPYVWVVAVVGSGAWVVTTAVNYLRYFKRRREAAEQRREDDEDFARYEAKVAELRGSALSDGEFEAALNDVRDEHRAMLERRFGRS